jgi:ankyrin repeat protein
MAQYESLTLAKLLVDHKCPLNLKSTQAGETPLFLACNSGFVEMVEYFLDQGVDVNDCSPPARTCFQQALFRGHKEIIFLLINRGYVLTDDDKNDLFLFIMDLYQDNDIDMINFLLSKNLIDKIKILECIAKVHEWQVQTGMESAVAASSNPNTNGSISSATTNASLETSSIVATLNNLNLDLTPPQQSYPKTIEELDLYLAANIEAEAQLSHSHSSDGELNQN